jgi:quinol monooxygenase YgiN/heme-degrading monooxygenase HmoA
MFARTTTVTGSPAAIDEGVRHVRDHVWPMLQGLSGCLGVSMLTDRHTGHCVVAAAWANAEDMAGHRETVHELQQQTAEALAAADADVAEWHIAVLHRQQESGAGACVRLTLLDFPHGDGAAVVEAFTQRLLPRLRHLPGFRSVSLLVDRHADRAAVAVTYEDRAAMHRAGGQGLALRADLTAATSATVTSVAEYDLALAHLRVPELT